MRTQEWQTVNQQEVGRRISRYWIWKIIWLICVVLVVLSYLAVTDGGSAWFASGFVRIFNSIYAFGGFLFALTVLSLLVGYQERKIVNILNEECDPYLYEACWHKTGLKFIKKNSHMYNLATAVYHQGNIEEAWNILSGVRHEKLKGAFLANYYILRSELYFRQGMGMQVRQLEDEFQLRIKNRADRRNMQRLCARNNYHRAYENKDYEAAYGFLQEYVNISDRLITLEKIMLSYYTALIDKESGNTDAAKAHLRFVIARGSRVLYAQEARSLLEQIELQEKHTAQVKES